MVFFSALEQKTAQFNFAPSSRLVYNWMQLILFFFLQLMVGHLTFKEKKITVRLTFSWSSAGSGDHVR